MLRPRRRGRVEGGGAPPAAGASRPVGRVTLDDAIHAALADLESALPLTEFTPQILDTLKRIYRPGVGMSAAFALLIEELLGPMGLVVYESSDPDTKPFVADLFAREIAMAGRRRDAPARRGAARAGGLPRPGDPRRGSLALFRLRDEREPIRVEGTTAVFGDDREPLADLEARARTEPAGFSPNVLLRPVVQDTLFPTVCYVGGPGETAYFAQLEGHLRVVRRADAARASARDAHAGGRQHPEIPREARPADRDAPRPGRIGAQRAARSGAAAGGRVVAR